MLKPKDFNRETRAGVEQEREAGNQILNVENLAYSIDNEIFFKKINFSLMKSDKVVLFSKNSRAIKAFYDILEGDLNADDGKFEWGITTNKAFLPSENDSYFKGEVSLIDWLRQYSKSDEEKEEVVYQPVSISTRPTVPRVIRDRND